MGFQKGNTLRKGKGKADGQGRPKGSRDEVISARLGEMDALITELHTIVKDTADPDVKASRLMYLYPTMMRYATPVHPEAQPHTGTTAIEEIQAATRALLDGCEGDDEA